MKKLVALLLFFAVSTILGITVYASVSSLPENNMPDLSKSVPIPTQETEDSKTPDAEEISESSPVTAEAPTSFSSTQDEIIYKMLNSIDYFTTAQVSFSALFPGFDTEQNYTIETNLNTGISHQTCSDNFIQTYSADTAEAYETYSDGNVVREYNNLNRTFYTVSAVQERRSLAEEWPDGNERYYVDENGDPHYRYRGNPTNADMAGECLFPQVSAFAYLMDKSLWEVSGTVSYCSRECYSITGIVNESYASQIGADTFMMYVDQQTGILLKLEAYGADKNVVSSMIVSEIQIDAPVAYSASAYDMSKYEDYTELTTNIE